MSTKKITQLQTATDITASDFIQVVDIEDGGMAPSGTNKKVTAQTLGNYLPVRALGSTTSRTLSARFADTVNVKDFGAVGDGVADDTSAIQAALDHAASNVFKVSGVRLPAGAYKTTSTLYIPMGIRFHGDAFHSETIARYTSVIKPTFNGDCIRFRANRDGPRNFYYGCLENFHIFNASTKVSGWGISFRLQDGSVVAAADSTTIRDITIREMPSGGIEFPNGALPVHVERVRLLFNNGPGIVITGGSNLHQAIMLHGISGDANTECLIKFVNLDFNGNVLITGIKSEMRINPWYGNIESQQNVIKFENCTTGTPITVIGGTHISSIPDGATFKKPGDFAVISSGGDPHFEWMGVACRVRVGDTGTDPCIVSKAGQYAIDYKVRSGSSSGLERVDRTPSSSGYRVFGASDSYQSKSIEGVGFQLSGVSPAYSLHETDGAVNSKTWILVASGGDTSLRAINDDGSLGKIIWTATRSRFDVGPNDTLGTYLRINGINTTSAVAGTATALPSNPVGYISININGIDRRMPYYATV